ncbi:MAG TPA: DUF3857 domain-containing transglutaminase family protein [Candidatus Acidoferrales bacterium]|nr:DUF3857 domain-containing transglutaminase family protein [Candidatus Acidoferrales bacterium]
MISAGFAILTAALLASSSARAAAPDWLRALVSAPLPSYPAKTDAVILLDERVISVKENGDIKTNRRVAFKILRREGSQYGRFSVAYDPDTRLTFLRAWCFPAGQAEYEVKEKDAVETGLSRESLYSDVRRKILSVPATDPGSIAGFEYEQRNRPFLPQYEWDFQQRIPVRKARLVLQLPTGWEFKPVWRNFTAKEPVAAANQWSWELDNLPGIEPEDLMPAWRAVASQMGLSYFAKDPSVVKNQANWRDVGAWYGSLAAPRLSATPSLASITSQVVAGATTPWKRLEALSAFVQKEIRYVAIPIGIGSHQPHAAADVLANRYGDCKDKVTLLKAMLKQVGIESYYLLVDSERGAVNPDFASVLNFDHVVLAIRRPAGDEAVFALVQHPVLGDLVVFDPTDDLTPLGTLPDSEQGAYGLLVREDGGELLRLPVHSPSACRLIRTGALKLLADGSLSGTVKEIRWGRFAAETRRVYRLAEGQTQAKILEDFVGRSIGQFHLTSGLIDNLNGLEDLTLTYIFSAPNYGKTTGPMLLLRPRVLGQKGLVLGEKKDRRYSVSLASNSVESDIFDIELPAEYEVDELPRPVTSDYPFARYTSKVEMRGNTLHYERHYLTRQVEIPRESFDDLWNFQRLISADERGYAVLRKRP